MKICAANIGPDMIEDIVLPMVHQSALYQRKGKQQAETDGGEDEQMHPRVTKKTNNRKKKTVV